MLVWSGRLAFRGYHGCDALCWIQEFRDHDRPTVVLATELPTNPGTSITNAAERLAQTYCNERGIDGETLLWVEHYLGSASSYAAPERAAYYDRERFSRVDFKLTPRREGGEERLILHSPVWHPVPFAWLRRLVGGRFIWPPCRAELIGAAAAPAEDSPL